MHFAACLNSTSFPEEGGEGGSSSLAVVCRSFGPSAIDFQVSGGELNTGGGGGRSQSANGAISLSQFVFVSYGASLADRPTGSFAFWKPILRTGKKRGERGVLVTPRTNRETPLDRIV